MRDGIEAMIKYGPDASRRSVPPALRRQPGIRVANVLPDSLQAKWKHAPALGIKDTWKAKDAVTHKKYIDAVNAIVAGADEVFLGPYHAEKLAAHFFNGDKLVITKLDGEFLSVWDNVANKLTGIRGTAPPHATPKNLEVR